MRFPATDRLLPLLFLLLCASGASGQSSPYSRYGIGDVSNEGVNQMLGMGGTSIGISNTLLLNLSNPANYGRLQATIFEAGVTGVFTELRDDYTNSRNDNINLSHFAFAVPLLNRKAGFGLGIIPLSSVGYSIKDPQINSLGQPELHAYEGSGGLNRFFLSSGFTIFKGLTLGASASVVYGDIVQDRRVEFSDATFLNTRLTDTRSHSGFLFDFGLQYTVDSLRISPSDSLSNIRRKISVLNDSTVARNSDSEGSLKAEIKRLKVQESKVENRRMRGDWSMTFGLKVTPVAAISANRTVVAETFRYLDASSRDQVVVKDTTYYNSGEKGTLRLPLALGFGMSMRKGSKWLIGSDLRIKNWSDYRSFEQTDSLADSWRWSAGAQFVPDERGFNAYWKQIQYMAGLHYSRSFLQLRDVQLAEAGFSLGFGLPVRRGSSFIRLMAEAGKRGTLSSGLLEERYVRFTLNFSLNDRWFIKQRYD